MQPVIAGAMQAAGALMVVAVARDVISELFHPEASGLISHVVMRGLWAVIRTISQRWRVVLYQAGPIILVSVVAVWAFLLVLAFALIYLPKLPSGFHVSNALPPSATHGFATAMYVSLAAMTTLGSSDIVPVADGVRFAGALESLLGVVLITAWITWVLSIYPVLADRRSFTREVDAITRAYPSAAIAVSEPPPATVAALLRSLAVQVVRICTQFEQSQVTYYFQNKQPEAALFRQVPYVLELAAAAERGDAGPEVRHHGTLLRIATEDLVRDMGEQFLDARDEPIDVVLGRLADNHLLGPNE